MRVQREVVAGETDVRVEERLKSPAHPPVDHARLVVPEQAVMDDHELGACGGRTLEELERGRDGADDPRDLLGADDLEALRAEVPERAEVEQLVRVGDDLVALGHRAAIVSSAPLTCLPPGCGAAW